MTEKKYVGITIGPIFDTMNLSSSPCALWASSFIFSYISRRICEQLVEEYKLPAENIISPVFHYEKGSELEAIIKRKDGVGLFHDRIIFELPAKSEFDFKTIIKEIKEFVLDDVNKQFQINDINFLKEYIMIVAAEYSAENPIMGSGKILDSLELSKPFVINETVNPIMKVFSGPSDSDDENTQNIKNETIKKIVRNIGCVDIDKWQLAKNSKGIKDLKSIAKATQSSNKYNDYYAVVRSDGDNISKIISSLSDKDAFRKFSGACLKYCSAIADTVKKYGGVAIYAGGDDLLALMPCCLHKDNNNETILNFIREANKIFADKFKDFIDKIKVENAKLSNNKKKPIPTLSFGIMICFYKFPLYEALEKSADLLFYKAKAKKDCAVICLQKHSGQSVELMIPNGSLDELINFQDLTLVKDEQVLLSALQKIDLFKVLFNSANTDTKIDNVFANTFDASSHIDNNFLHKTLPNYFKKLKGTYPVFSHDEKEGKAEILSEIMRFFKFFVEEGNGWRTIK